MERHYTITKEFQEAEYSHKLEKASDDNPKTFTKTKYEEDDWVFYQDKLKKSWLGPVKVFCQRGENVWVWANGDLKKVAKCKIQTCRKRSIPEEEKVENEDIPKENVEKYIGPKTRSKSKEREEEKDSIGAYWMTVENSECFSDDQTVFVVEVPVKYHKLPEIVEAKETEMKNLEDFDTFEEVQDIGQAKVGSRWVITEKEKHDGQKKKYKARLVAKGFQEEVKPQADSPTALRDSFKLFHATAANEEFEIESMDIRAAFYNPESLTEKCSWNHLKI
jgi:hypothetical protein